jgi:hypothetical protein
MVKTLDDLIPDVNMHTSDHSDHSPSQGTQNDIGVMSVMPVSAHHQGDLQREPNTSPPPIATNPEPDSMPPAIDAPDELPPITTNGEAAPAPPPEAIGKPCFQCGKFMKPLDDIVSGWECINCDGSGNGAWMG